MRDSDPQKPSTQLRERMPLRGWIVATSLVAAAVILLVAAYLAWQAAQGPFPGFFTEPTLVLLVDKEGVAWGHDPLVMFEDQPLEHPLALMRELEQRELGETVELTAQSVDGAAYTFSVRLDSISAG